MAPTAFPNAVIGILFHGCSGDWLLGPPTSLQRIENSSGSPRPICSYSGPSSDRYQPPRRRGGPEILNHDALDSGESQRFVLIVQFFTNGGVTPNSRRLLRLLEHHRRKQLE